GPWVRTPPPPPIAPLAARFRGGVPMRASEWEFRQRFWIYAGIFLLGYALYRFDPQNVVTRSVCAWRRARGLPLTVPRVVYRAVFGVAAALAVAGAALRTWAAAYLRSEVVHDA